MEKIGSKQWNNEMFLAHPTPYQGIAGWIERRRIAAIRAMIRKHPRSESLHIVEIGCESGNLLLALHQAFPQAKLTGIDISSSALEQAKKRFTSPQVHWIEADVCEGLAPLGTCDFIICSETLEHIPDYQKALEQIAAFAQQNSVLIFTVPLEALKNRVKNVLNKLGLMQVLFKGIEPGSSAWHVNDFTSSQFKEIISQHFRIRKYRQIMGLHQLILASNKPL